MQPDPLFLHLISVGFATRILANVLAQVLNGLHCRSQRTCIINYQLSIINFLTHSPLSYVSIRIYLRCIWQSFVLCTCRKAAKSTTNQHFLALNHRLTRNGKPQSISAFLKIAFQGKRKNDTPKTIKYNKIIYIIFQEFFSG